MADDKPKPERPQFSPSDAMDDLPTWYIRKRCAGVLSAVTTCRIDTTYSVPTINGIPTGKKD